MLVRSNRPGTIQLRCSYKRVVEMEEPDHPSTQLKGDKNDMWKHNGHARRQELCPRKPGAR